MQAALERTEGALHWHRERLELGEGRGLMCCGKAVERHIELLDTERAGFEDRLRVLLDDGGEAS